MSELDELYRELILDHSKRRVGSPLQSDPSAGEHSGQSHQLNPMCGDEVTLRASVDANGVIDSLSWDGSGCAISQASVSMLSELMVGKTLSDAGAMIDTFREALRSRGTIELDEEVFEDAAALTGASKFSARVKCAMLGWVALEDALRQAQNP